MMRHDVNDASPGGCTVQQDGQPRQEVVKIYTCIIRVCTDRCNEFRMNRKRSNKNMDSGGGGGYFVRCLSNRMRQTPIRQPTMIESLRRLDFIIPKRLLMPGIVLSTPPIRVLMPVMVVRWWEKSARVSYACLQNVSTSPSTRARREGNRVYAL